MHSAQTRMIGIPSRIPATVTEWCRKFQRLIVTCFIFISLLDGDNAAALEQVGLLEH